MYWVDILKTIKPIIMSSVRLIGLKKSILKYFSLFLHTRELIAKCHDQNLYQQYMCTQYAVKNDS